MKHLILTFVAGLFTMPATASTLNGVWKGSGSYFDSKAGQHSAISEVAIELTSNSLRVRDCWQWLENSTNFRRCSDVCFDVRGNHIEYHGKSVGVVNSPTIELMHVVTGKLIARVSLNSNGTLDYWYNSTAPEDNYLKTEASGLIQ